MITRRGFLGGLLAAPVLAYAAPKELLPAFSAPPNGATSFATLTAGQNRLWSAALWHKVRDYGHITQFAAEFKSDRMVEVDGVELVLGDGTVIHSKFTMPRTLYPDDELRVNYEMYTKELTSLQLG